MSIEIREVELRLGARELFRGISGQILGGERIGLVGANGSGKSTLLRMIAGKLEPDRGSVVVSKGTRIGYLTQDIVVARGRKLREEAESAFPQVVAARERIESIHNAIEGLDPETPVYRNGLEEIGAAEHFLEGEEAHKVEARIQKVLAGLGFANGDLDRDTGEFSGGWQMRIALARLLLQEPDLLMLDEPTNHLDLDSLRWFESYLKGYEGSVLLVSHDRAFLNQVTNKTMALEFGRMEIYAGNYAFYEVESRRRREMQERARLNQEKEIARQERFIERFRSKATKATQVQSRIKQLDKIERIEATESRDKIHFRFPPAERSAHTVMEMKDLGRRYGNHTVLHGIDFELQRGDRVAVVGINGAGKSTFIRILAGRDENFSGERRIGGRVTVGYFEQDQAEAMDPSATVMEIAEAAAERGVATDIRNILGAFLFSGDDIHKRVGVLSGGEKNRLALARLLLRRSNCLVLDEPTNHLDMDSKDVLQDALKHYDGTMVIVSHDRDFLDPLVNKVLELRPGGFRLFQGNVSDYLWKIDAEAAARTASAAAAVAASGSGTGPRNELNPRERRRREAALREQSAPLRKKVASLETAIAEFERKIAEREKAMFDPSFFQQSGAAEAMREYEDWKRRLDHALEEWTKLTEQVEKLESSLDS